MPLAAQSKLGGGQEARAPAALILSKNGFSKWRNVINRIKQTVLGAIASPKTRTRQELLLEFVAFAGVLAGGAEEGAVGALEVEGAVVEGESLAGLAALLSAGADEAAEVLPESLSFFASDL